MSITQKELDVFIQAVQETYMVNLAAAAATTWLAFDIILTMPQEIALVWRSKWTIHKCLYYVVRYWTMMNMIFTLAVNTDTKIPLSLPPLVLVQGFVSHISIQSFFFRSQDLPSSTGPFTDTSAGEALFVIRIYALYGGSRKVLIVIVTLYLMEFIGAIIPVILEVGSITTTPRTPDYPIPGCLSTLPRYAELNYLSWTISMFASCVFFLLTLYKFITSLYPRGETVHHPNIFELRHLTPIFYLFVRDGVFYFFVIFVVNLLNLIFTGVLATRALEQMGTAWIMATYGVMSSRLYLNLRGSISDGGQTTTWNDIELRERSIARGPVFAPGPVGTTDTIDTWMT